MKTNLQKPKYDVTRYLCAAAELDRNFRNTVFNQVVHNAYRFVAKSYGVDLPRVVRQCLRVQNRDLALDLILSALLLFYVIVHFYRDGLYGIITFIPAFVFSGPFLLSFAAICGSKLFTYREVSRNLSRDKFYNQEQKETFIESIYAERLAELQQLEEGNTIYYSGYSPFVGAGHRIGGWSFVFSTQSQTDQHKYVDISLKSMYDTMEDKIRNLQINGMSIHHGLFVDGKSLRKQSEFLPNELAAPLANVGEEVIQACMDTLSEPKRYYKVVQISGWQGNFIFSTFFRLTKNDRQMFVEGL